MTMVVEPEMKLEHPSERLTRNLAADVEGALWAYDPIRQSGGTIGVAADDAGAIELSGVVPSRTIAEIAEYIATGVTGVTSVNNTLVSDTELQSSVARAIANDPSVGVSTDRITISSLLGLVYLGGQVASPSMADAEASVERAGELAMAVPGVREIVNQIVAIEAEAETAGDAGAGPAGDVAAEAEGADGPSPEEMARAERLSIWRERASNG